MPDDEDLNLDLLEQRVRPLRRAAAFPDDIWVGTYHFDAKTPAQIEELASEARALADVLNFPHPSGTDARTQGAEKWYVSATSQVSFGTQVPDDALSTPDLCVVRDAVGLVNLDNVWYRWPGCTPTTSRLGS